jgi:hypothetical protein
MAFNLWKALGLEKKSAPDTSAYTNAVRPFQSLTEIPTGAALNETILAALKSGKGIGFGPEYTDRTTSPLVATRAARFQEEELPALESGLSSRGLSRSTLGARDIGKATAAKERDINDIIAQAYKDSEAQKKLDQSRYEGLGMQFTGAESAQRTQYAAEDAARMKYASDLENAYRQEKDAERITNINKTIGLAAKGAGYLLAPVTGGASIAVGEGLSGAMNSGNYSYGELLDLAKQAKNTTSSTESPSPFTGKKNIQSAYGYFKNLK